MLELTPYFDVTSNKIHVESSGKDQIANSDMTLVSMLRLWHMYDSNDNNQCDLTKAKEDLESELAKVRK